jgi:tetratricopeptide (TPR) repeat protein
VYYQDHDNYEEAAAAYAQASALHASDHILSRILYLKRRYGENAADVRDYRNLFRPFPTEWMERLALAPAQEKALKGRMMDGSLGTYLMINWYVSPLPDISSESAAAMDTALQLFTRLHAMDPAEPLYLDSLATLSYRRGDLAASARQLRQLIRLYPFGNDHAYFRLAWTQLKLGKVAELGELLPLCGEYSREAKFLTMKAALAMHKGQYRRAYRALSRSLKLDKAVGETHTLLADYYRLRGDKPAEQVHLRWLRRNT